MKRREFITLLGGAVAWPLAARAAEPRPRIAVLSINSEQDESKNIAAFVDGLRALGYVSQNVKLLELALDAVPGSTRIGLLANPAGASMALWVQQVETAGALAVSRC